jgi:hypothetical protein
VEGVVSNHDSYSDFHCALNASIVGSISHPVGDRPSPSKTVRRN